MRASTVVLALAGAAVGAALVLPRPKRDLRRALRRALPRRPMDEEAHAQSATALAGEALRTGVTRYGVRGRSHEIPPDEERLRMGDPDVDLLRAAHVGDEGAGGD